MKHYLRFVRTLAISGSLVGCGGGGEEPAQPAPEPVADTAQVADDAGAAADAAVINGTDAAAPITHDSQTVADAGALADAAKAPFSSGPLAPPELPAQLRG